MSLFKDTTGKLSMSRIALFSVTVFVLVMASFSLYTGNDVGDNLTNIFMSFFAMSFGKMGSESFVKKNA